MNINILVDYLIISTVASIAINYLLRNIAKGRNILVDLPDKSRKFHKRPTPLTGGLGILMSLLISGKLYLDLNELNGFMPLFSAYLILTSFLLVIFFLLDDIFQLNVKLRLAAQIMFSYFIIHNTGVLLENFGDLLGFGGIEL